LSRQFLSLCLKQETAYLNTQRRNRRIILKTEMTSFDVAAVVFELNQTIKDARIENIYQPNASTLLLKLHRPSQQAMQLLIEAGKRIHLTSYVLKKPLTPPTFCMTLRKYLRNTKIMDIQQHEFERSVVLKISAREGPFLLIAELFGEGNIVLVNPQGTITAALTYRRMRDRNVLRNEIFKHAPPSGRNPYRLEPSGFEELKSFGRLEVVRALTRFLSIGGLYAEEILLRGNIDKKTPCQALTPQQLDHIFAQLKTMLSHLSEGRLEPSIVLDQKDLCVDATPLTLRTYDELKRRPVRSINEALDEYYSHATRVEKVASAEKEYEKELAKHQRILENQQETIEDSQRALERNKLLGDLLYRHLSELQLLVEQMIDEKRKGETWVEIVNQFKNEKQARRTPAIYFDSLDTKNQILSVVIDGNVIPMKINRSVQANAAEYYERMKKAERKLEGSKRALQETETRIKGLQQSWTRKIEETEHEAPKRRLEKAWYEKFRWFQSSEGFLIVAGKDATTNEILIKKHVEPQDIVFHADIVGAPFVVVKTQGKPPSDQVIIEAAQLAACYSRAWREMLGAIDVYWVYPSQVIKTPPSGQFLEKGSFLIQGVKNYVRKVQLRIGIGLLMKGGRLAVIGGPAEGVSKQTKILVEVVPGQEGANVLIKRIRREFSEKAPKSWREGAFSIPNQEFQGLVPFGRGELTLK